MTPDPYGSRAILQKQTKLYTGDTSSSYPGYPDKAHNSKDKSFLETEHLFHTPKAQGLGPRSLLYGHLSRVITSGRDYVSSFSTSHTDKHSLFPRGKRGVFKHDAPQSTDEAPDPPERLP